VDVRACLYLALMVLIGSSTAPAARYVVRGLPAGLVPLVRFGVAGLCLLPLARRGGGGGLARMAREDGWRLVASAALCVPVNQTFFLNATRLTATSHVALIYAAVPMVVLFLAAAVGQERLRADRLAGVAASVLGVAVIGLENLGRSGAATAAAGPSSAMIRGDLLLVGAVVSWGAYLTVSKPLVARHGALAALAGTFLLGTALDLPVALMTLPGWPPLSSAPRAAWLGLAYLTLFVSVVGLAFQNLALRRLDASQVATFGNAAPVLTVIWGVWLFEETVSPALALGGALTMGGILWTSRPARVSTRAVEAEPFALGGRIPATLPRR
jgi:drug/metabolite transporter (DMT)-like permease